jgi:hypothetical protein
VLVCEENPDALQCREGSFSGSCQGGFQCSGDAVQCAAARGVHETKCALKPLETSDTDPTVVIGKNAITGGDPSDHPKNQKQEKSIGTFDQTNPFSAGGVSDISIDVLGTPTVIPLSQLNSTLALLGQLLVGLTMLCSALWLVKG